MTYLENVATLKLETEACTGCGVCLDVCPSAVFRLNDGKPRKAEIADLDACIECGACARNCAFAALTVDAGVGCASAFIQAALTGKEAACGCSDDADAGCCGPAPKKGGCC